MNTKIASIFLNSFLIAQVFGLKFLIHHKFEGAVEKLLNESDILRRLDIEFYGPAGLVSSTEETTVGY